VDVPFAEFTTPLSDGIVIKWRFGFVVKKDIALGPEKKSPSKTYESVRDSGMSNAPNYVPYVSDSETSESSSDDESTDSNDIYYTTKESLLRSPENIPLISPNKVFGQIFRSTEPKPRPKDTTSNVASLSDASSKIDFKESRNTTLFMINSRDRDTNIYPQPTFFTLRLPRLFRNITTLNISQINLLNSFFNFSLANGNTYMNVYEQGRTIVGSSTNSIKITIRDGTYSASDLVTELNSAMNATPLFASITFIVFNALFQTSGDFTPLFNTPGAVVYNSLTQSYDRNVSIQDIVARYFQVSQSAGTLTYSFNESLVAYYYPVMKEMMLDPVYGSTPPFNTIRTMPPSGYPSWYDYIVFGFTGLNDVYITAMATDKANQAIFDVYRNQKTYNEFLVNAYTCSYNAKQGRLVISAPSLSQSITTDLNTQYNNILATVVGSNSQFTSVDDFQNQYNNVVNSNGFIIEFYNYMQSRFSSNFAINFGTYSPSFYGLSTNRIALYNPTDRYGWSYTLTPAVSESTADTAVTTAPQVDNYWSNIKLNKLLGDPNISTFVSTLVVPSFNGTELTFSNASESVYGYTDISFAILPTSYIRNEFTSRCRQTISLMTIPRYINERSPDTEEVYNLGSTTTSLLFAKTTDLTKAPAYNILTDISGNPQFNMYTLSQSMLYSADYMRAEDQWLNFTKVQILSGSRIQQKNTLKYNTSPPVNDIRLTNYRPYLFLQLNADKYYYEDNAHFYIRFYVETQDGSSFQAPITITWYKDRAGFMADILTPLTGGEYNSENPRHYFLTKTLSGSSDYIDVDVNNSQETYFYIHVQNSSYAISSIPLRVFGVLRDTYGDYTITTHLERLDMPFANLPPLIDQFSPNSAVFKNPTTSIFDPSITQLGYDSNNVSNNLLDYTIQAASDKFYDPNNISDYVDFFSTGLRYEFDSFTNGARRPDPSISSPAPWSLYFGSNTNNVVLDTYNTNPVYLSTLQSFSIVNDYNDTILTNWFNPNSAVKEFFFTPTGTYTINANTPQDTIFIPCINNTTPLITDMSTTTAFLDNTGIAGISFFLPPNNVVKLDSMVVKFAYTQPSTDQVGNNTSRQLYPDYTIGNAANYQNRTTYIQAANPPDSWDDWFLYNRRNVKLGIFETAYVSSVSSLSLGNALYTMTLQKVTQVNNLTNNTGTLNTREPDWGTYYTYAYEPFINNVWSVSNPVDPYNPGWADTFITPADISPTYVSGDTSYPSFFLTHPSINNDTYLPRSYGIAPSVGNAVNNPYTGVPSWTTDVQNSYTAVPFYYDQNSGVWRTGSFYGVSFTRTPVLPNANLIGDAPFYGPPGIFAWNYAFNPATGYDTFQLMNGEQPTFQPYYWNIKINFENLYLTYDTATDLVPFGNFNGITTEYQDTMLFFYENKLANADLNDISTNTTTWAWGQEKNSNYSLVDDQSGYNYLSYIHDITVRSTVQYATHVRAYDPIPTFVTGLRFIGKNFTDFGNPTLQEIAQEITSLQGYQPISDISGNDFINDQPGFNTIINANNAIRLGNGNAFSHAYADQLILFDRTFMVNTITFGAKIGFSGVTLSNGFTGFADAYTQYLQYYSTINSLYSDFTSILSTTQGQLNQYIIARYGSVLPSTITSRNRFTDPLPFQLLLSTTLVAPYTGYYDGWGLGYYLGFNKQDRPDLPRTTVTSDTFIRIVQDYIYLRINPEQNANTMGVSAKENLAETRESQGEDTKYFSKIILNDFGAYSRTAMIQPKEFKPVLGRLETMTCQLVDKNGQQINNTDCEYDMVLELTELTNMPKDTDSLSGPLTDLAVYRR
jgi:hypothetical protein